MFTEGLCLASGMALAMLQCCSHNNFHAKRRDIHHFEHQKFLGLI